MRAERIEHIGQELAIRWDDGQESFFFLERLRRSCPCAGCSGETDILGNVYKNPATPLPAAAFTLVRFVPVGGYAVQLCWADGHQSGIFAFDYLRRMDQTKR
jgi:DUF971 family protein